MNFPAPNDFLEAFGLYPDSTDEADLFFKYVCRSKAGHAVASLSFSGISESFQINLSSCGEEVMVISSEQVDSISIYEGEYDSGVKVIFSHNGLSSEARITLEPDLKINWWMLRA